MTRASSNARRRSRGGSCARAAPDNSNRLQWALSLVLGRPATSGQVEVLQKLLDDRAGDLSGRRRPRRKSWRPAKRNRSPADADAAELAAWTVVANVLLNLDGVLTKG